MRAWLLLLTPLLMGSAWEKSASDWTFEKDAYTIWVKDELTPGFVDNLKVFIKASNKHIVAIELDSWGGDGDEGIKLADLISHWPKKVVILGRCLSACSFAAFVALGQGKLFVGENAIIGVHQVRDTETQKADVQWTKMARRILLKYGAPKAPLDVMVSTPPSSMTLFHEDQLISWGAAALQTGWLWWYFGEDNE